MLRSQATKQMVHEFNMTPNERLKESYKRMRKAKMKNSAPVKKTGKRK